MHCTPGERARGTGDFAMNRFLLIAVYGDGERARGTGDFAMNRFLLIAVYGSVFGIEYD